MASGVCDFGISTVSCAIVQFTLLIFVIWCASSSRTSIDAPSVRITLALFAYGICSCLDSEEMISISIEFVFIVSRDVRLFYFRTAYSVTVGNFCNLDMCRFANKVITIYGNYDCRSIPLIFRTSPISPPAQRLFALRRCVVLVLRSPFGALSMSL